MRTRGFTLPELLVALAIGALVLMLAVPSVGEALRASRLTSATQELLGDIREARYRAITTGWEQRIVGFDRTDGTHANAYRVLSRRSPATGWPADMDAPFESPTAAAGDWIRLGDRYPGVTLNAATPSRFELTFDARGGATGAGASFNTLRVEADAGKVRALSVSVVGGMSVQ